MDSQAYSLISKQNAVPSQGTTVNSLGTLINETDLSPIEQARQVLAMESTGILDIAKRLDINFEKAIDLLSQCQGKVVVTGMGKSGHIGCKVAATFASTGTPSFFIHPAELRHGDFGMMDERDLVLAISSSGETSEIKLALDPMKRLGIKIIALTGNIDSTLALFSDVALDISVEREACPLNLAPTTSTTAALAMGDALAVVLMMKKGFSTEDFVHSHPGGSLGKQLLTVKDIMRSGIAIPTVGLHSSYSEILTEIDAKKLGLTAVCDSTNSLVGVITDGDLRRTIIKFGASVFAKHAKELMTADPKTIAKSSLAVEALKLMEKYSIADLMIVDDQQRPIGLIDLKDLLKAGII